MLYAILLAQAKGANVELHLKIKNVQRGAIRVCGYSQKESLKHALFYIDPNYEFEEAAPISPEVMETATSGSSHEYVTPDRKELPALPEYRPTE